MQEKQTSRETLAFPSPEKAKEFTERVEHRVEQEQQPEINRDREIVGEELAKEFSHEGESVSFVSTPWEHSEEEHKQAQQLVRIALEKDLKTAIEKAKLQDGYPRNIDLFHDLLTTELYSSIQSKGLTRESLSPWLILLAGVAAIAALLVFYALVFL